LGHFCKRWAAFCSNDLVTLSSMEEFRVKKMGGEQFWVGRGRGEGGGWPPARHPREGFQYLELIL